MTFQKKKKAPPGVEKKSGKTFVVSVRLDEEQHKTALEKCRKSTAKITTFFCKDAVILLYLWHKAL